MLIKRKWILLPLFTWMILILTGCSLFPQEEQPLKPPLIQPPKDTIQLYTVKKGTIEKALSGAATFEPSNVVVHSFKQSNGVIESIRVKAGDTVKKGDILAQLEMGDLPIQVKRDELQVAEAKLNVNTAKKSGNTDLIQINTMKLDIAKMQLQADQKILSDKILRSKIDGIITFVAKLKTGDTVPQYMDLVSVADPHQLRLSYPLTLVSDGADVQLGMKANITYNGNNYTGTVVQTPTSAPSTGNSALDLKNQNFIIFKLDAMPINASLGDNANIDIVLQKKENTLIIPKNGLHRFLGSVYVEMMINNSRKEVDVKTGIETAAQVEILKGLHEGQQIILQ